MKIWEVLLSILAGAYEGLWKATASRPLTYVMREWVDKHPRASSVILPFVFACALGASRLLKVLPDGGWWWFWTILIAFTWALASHCFWDTAGAYIPKPRKRKK